MFGSREFAVGVVLLGAITDVNSYAIIIPIIQFIMADIGEPESFIGVLLALYGTGVVLGSIFFGYLSSHTSLSKKWLMVSSLFALGLATILFALGRTFWMFAVARFFEGFACNGVWVLGMSVIADAYQDDESNMGKAMSIVMAGFSTGLLIGPPIGGALFKLNYYAPFMFCGFLITLDLIGRLLIPEKRPQPLETSTIILSSDTAKPQPPTSIPTTPTPPSFKSLFKYKTLWLILLLNTSMSIVTNGIEPTLPLKLNSQFGYDSTQIGIVWIALIIPQVVGGIAGGYLYDAFGLKRTFLVGLGCTTVSMFLLAVPGPDHVAWICCVLVVTGLSFGIGLAPVSPGIAASIPQEYHTMGYSLSSIVFAIGICVGPVVGSFVYQSVGWMWQTVLFGCVMVVSTMIAFLLPDPRTTKDECTNGGA